MLTHWCFCMIKVILQVQSKMALKGVSKCSYSMSSTVPTKTLIPPSIPKLWLAPLANACVSLQVRKIVVHPRTCTKALLNAFIFPKWAFSNSSVLSCLSILKYMCISATEAVVVDYSLHCETLHPLFTLQEKDLSCPLASSFELIPALSMCFFCIDCLRLKQIASQPSLSQCYAFHPIVI